MSELTRYRLDPESYLAQHPDGDFVDYQDYASLKAFSDEAQAHIAKEERKSRERLDMERAENARLKAEVERLTKAGDAMAEEIALAKRQDEGSRFDPIEMHYDHELIVKWNAAKEGKQP